MTVNWTSDQSLSGGEFGVWVRSATEDWYIGQLVPATGDFTKTITLGLPAGSGYQVILAYRPTAGSGSWGSWTTSWWSFAVTAGLPYLTITSPTGPGTYASGSAMTVNWTSDQSLSGGQFCAWVRSGSGTWYIGQLVPASGGTDFTTDLVLNVPTGTGYQVHPGLPAHGRLRKLGELRHQLVVVHRDCRDTPIFRRVRGGLGAVDIDRESNLGYHHLSGRGRFVVRVLRRQLRRTPRSVSQQHGQLDGSRSVRSIGGHDCHAGIRPVPEHRTEL